MPFRLGSPRCGNHFLETNPMGLMKMKTNLHQIIWWSPPLLVEDRETHRSPLKLIQRKFEERLDLIDATRVSTHAAVIPGVSMRLQQVLKRQFGAFPLPGRFYFQDSILPVLLSAMPLLLNLLKTRCSVLESQRRVFPRDDERASILHHI